MLRSRMTRLGLVVAALAVAGQFAATNAGAATFTWNVNAAGNWSAKANWNPNSGFPNNVDDVASLTNDINAARTVTLDVPVTIGTLNIGDSVSSYRAFTISGANTLTFDVTGGSAKVTRPTAANNAADIISVPVQINADLLITSNASGSLAFNGIISESGGAKNITIDGPHTGANLRTTTKLAGANTYTGLTTIVALTGSTGTSRNTVIVQNAKGLGTTAKGTVIEGTSVGGRLELDGSFVLAEPLDLGGDNASIATILTDNSARIVGGASEADNSNNELSGDITTTKGLGANYLIRADGGINSSFKISGNITRSDGLSGALILGGATGTDVPNGTISGAIQESSGTWDVYKGAAGSWTLSGANTYTGTTTVAQGVLVVGNNGAKGNLGSGNVILSDPSANNNGLVLNRSDTALVINNQISGVGNIHQANPSGGTSTLGGNNTYTGYTHIYQGNLVITNSNALGDNTAAGTGAGGKGQGGFTAIYDPTDDFTRGSLQIGNNANTPEVLYLDSHTTNASGTAQVYAVAGSNSQASGVISTDLPDGPYLDGTWKYYTFQSNTSSFLTLSGDLRQDVAGAAILTLRGAGGGLVSGNIIQPTTSYYHNTAVSGNTWALDKEGSGTWTLSGSNSYTGTTTVGNGVLLVNGTNTGGDTFTVLAGGALGGNGNTGAAVSISLNAGLAPGVDNTAGQTLTMASLNLASGAISAFDLQNTGGNHAGSGSDLVSIGGGLTLPGSGLVFNVGKIGGGLLGASGVWELMSYGGSVTGSLGSYTVNGVDPAYSAAVSVGSGFNGNGVYLTLTPIPEPSTFVLAGLGLVGLCALRSRRRGSK